MFGVFVRYPDIFPDSGFYASFIFQIFLKFSTVEKVSKFQIIVFIAPLKQATFLPSASTILNSDLDSADF